MTKKTQTTAPAEKPEVTTSAVESAAGQSQESAVQSTTDATAEAAETKNAPVTDVQPGQAAKRGHLVSSVPIRHDGEFYNVGQSISLTDAEAQRLGGLVALVPETAKE